MIASDQLASIVPDEKLVASLVPALVCQVLGSARANGVGSVTWTWEIGPNTGADTALATIVCGAGMLRRRFTIR